MDSPATLLGMTNHYHCSDCGRVSSSSRSNAKYCPVCRLSRNLKWIGDRTNKCVACNKEFAFLERGDVLCGDCELYWPNTAMAACTYCGTDKLKTVLNAQIRVCLPCAKDPEKRSMLRGSLVRNIQAAKEQEQEPLPVKEIPQV